MKNAKTALVASGALVAGMLCFGKDIYRNDFSSYSGSLVETDEEIYRYWDVAQTLNTARAATNLVSNVEYDGRDNWCGRSYNSVLRIASTGGLGIAGRGGNVLMAVQSGTGSAANTADYEASAQHEIGCAISNGFMKMEYDFRTPLEWVSNTGNRTFTVWVNGTAPLVVTGFTDNKTDKHAGKFYPYVHRVAGSNTDSSSGNAITEVELSPTNWYRASVVADISNSRYDYKIYHVGTSPIAVDDPFSRAPIFETNSVPFRSNGTPGPFTTWRLRTYNFQQGRDTAHYLDNVRIWKGTDGVNWKLIYQNNFNIRKRYGLHTYEEASLVGAGQNDVGIDSWTRRGTGTADVYVRNSANPYVTIEGEGSSAHVIHAFSKKARRGTLVVRADIRPPSKMTNRASHPASIFIGGDEYAQGATAPTSFENLAAGHFGFAISGNSITPKVLGYYNNVKIYAEGADGEQLCATELSGDALMKWYRFVATFDINSQTWDLCVFDQGTAQPALDDANGTVVGNITGLRFNYWDSTALSAIGIAGGGTNGSAPLEADKKGVLFDNIAALGSDDATIITIH